ncbi:MAG: hypothetical protein KC466_15100, partial [Myxococcales bacterium]|nr:hypothetical protein [Myxococcales bacterium]
MKSHLAACVTVVAIGLSTRLALGAVPVPFDLDASKSYFAACVSIVDPATPPFAVRVLADGTLTAEFDPFAPIPAIPEIGGRDLRLVDMNVLGTQEVPQFINFDNTTITSIAAIPTTGFVRATAPDTHEILLTNVNIRFESDVSIQIPIPPFPPIVIGPVHFETLILDGGQFPVPDAIVPLGAVGGGPCTLGEPCEVGNDGGNPVPSFEEIQSACDTGTLCAEGDLCLSEQVGLPIGGDVVLFDFQAKLVFRAASTATVPPTADVILENSSTGDFAMWLTLGATVQSEMGGPIFDGWEFLAAGDFDDDGDTDALFRDTQTDGVCAEGDQSALVVAILDGNEIQGFEYLGCVPPGYAYEAAGDVDGDGGADL